MYEKVAPTDPVSRKYSLHVKPEVPSNPDVPDVPDVPLVPEVPDVPEVPEVPEAIPIQSTDISQPSQPINVGSSIELTVTGSILTKIVVGCASHEQSLKLI